MLINAKYKGKKKSQNDKKERQSKRYISAQNKKEKGVISLV